MLSYKWDEFIFWAVPFVLTGRAAVKAGEGTAGGPALRTARYRGEERQSSTRVWTQTKSLPLPSVSNSLAKRLRDEPAGCNTVEQMYSNERCLAAPRALHTRPSPPALTTSWPGCSRLPRSGFQQPKMLHRALGHTVGSTLKCSPALLQAKLLGNVYQGVTCVSLLERDREISWMLPVSSGLLRILWCVSCIHCLSLHEDVRRPLPLQAKKRLDKEQW